MSLHRPALPEPTSRGRIGLLILAVLAAVALPAGAVAEQASQPASPAAGLLAGGRFHSCAVQGAGVRCWGYGGDGALGYGNPTSIGDNETPGSAGPVDVGAGRTVRAIAAGSFHTCAVLDTGTVRCWGFGGDGRLGYATGASVGAGESPGSVGPVDLGAGRTATAISAGNAHTCAVLDDGSVRCWGSGFDGRLGYGATRNVGDVQTPGSVGPVKLGAGRTARAISAGSAHTCALLDDGSVRCWGSGASGRLGYAEETNVGDTATTTPDTAGPVDLGPGRTATAISAGGNHTCAVLDDGTVRCWGFGGGGRLGYANPANIGDDETPGSAGPVDLGPGRTAKAISTGSDHTCAVLDDGSVRCWGSGTFGQLGYASTTTIGDDETPGSTGPVDLGPGRTATAVDAGDLHTCARLDDGGVRCWGFGDYGQLGYCNVRSVGDDETPGSAGPVDFGTGNAGCPASAAGPAPGPGVAAGAGPSAPTVAQGMTPASGSTPPAGPPATAAERAQRLRELEFRGCLTAASRRGLRAKRRARRACAKRYGRTPGRVTRLGARAASRTKVVLSFSAAGSDGARPPAARAYVISQTRRGRGRPGRAQLLCKGSCRFAATVGMKLSLTVTDLRPRSTYAYTITARDNVTGRRGRRSAPIRVRTR